MARVRVEVDFIDNTDLLTRRIRNAMKDAMTDIVLDLKRVASLSAPHDTGFLEKNAQHEVYLGAKYMEGSVGFSAVEKGFNYAKWTHDKDYNLGEKSARKRGGRSGIGGGGIVPVGKGYLENALQLNEQGYLDYLRDKYREALR